MIDYKKLGDEAKKMNNTALEMFLDPKTKLSAMADIYKMLEISEMVSEIVKEHQDEGNHEIKDELMAGDAKFELYKKTKNVEWLKASDVGIDHAALYMKHYNDYSMKDWHDLQKARNKYEMTALGY